MTTYATPAEARRALRGGARARIIAAADRAFAATGYEGTSLARVAESVGLSPPGLLHHFPSKRALLMAVIEHRDAVDGARTGLSGQVEGLAALDALMELMEHNATVRGLVQSFTVLTGESAAEDHPARSYFTRRYARIRGELAGALLRGVERGEVREGVDALAVASEVFAVMDGLELQWLHAPDQVDMVRLFRAYLERLRADLAAPAPTS